MKFRLIVMAVISLMTLLISSCYGTKTISLDHKDIYKKEKILVYDAEDIYELLDFNFDSTALSGDLWKATIPDLSKSRKVKYLEVYLYPDYTLPEIDNSNRHIKIPNDSIVRIESTRFRAEYSLLIIPVYFIGGLAIFAVGGLFQH